MVARLGVATFVANVTIDASGNHLAIYASVAIGPGLTPEVDGASEVEQREPADDDAAGPAGPHRLAE